MEIVVNLLGEVRPNGRHFGKLCWSGIADVVDRAKYAQELFLAMVAKPWYFVETRSPHSFRALLAVKRYGKAMGFIPEPPQKLDARLFGIGFEGIGFPRQKNFFPLFGKTNHRQLVHRS
jgi:hypothetical protein